MKLTKVVASVSVFFVVIVVSLLSLVAFYGASIPTKGRFATWIRSKVLHVRSVNFPSINDAKNVATDVITPSQAADVAETKTNVEVIDQTIEKNGREMTGDATKGSCKSSFPLKCEMYPYVQFWNKVLYKEDCYQSPLRHPLGGKAPPEEQKYVVFQPDNGGWNNIRMAAETVMIFAHATGRYSNYFNTSTSKSSMLHSMV